MHSAQASILHTLRHVRSARYTDLRLPTGLDSDVFKFHINKLVGMGYIRKLNSTTYELTAVGKEFANNLSKERATIQKQPKLSVAIIATRDFDGTVKHLFQQRLRSPYYGFWGCLTGPVQWGGSIETTAQHEFEKQTGMTADYTVQAFYRKTDSTQEVDGILEDKLFAVVEAVWATGEITNSWGGGFNAWMTLDELQKQEKHFASTYDFAEMLENKEHYRSQTYRYTLDEY